MLSILLEAYRMEKEINCNLQRQADQLNGCIISESDSDDPSAVHTSKSPLDPNLKALVLKRRKSIRKQRQRLMAKKISEQIFFTGRLQNVKTRSSKCTPICDRI